MGERLLRNAGNLGAAIQKKEISAAESHCLARKTVATISKIRTDDSFDLFWNLVTKKDEDKAVEDSKLPRQRMMPALFGTSTADAEFQTARSIFSLLTVYKRTVGKSEATIDCTP